MEAICHAQKNEHKTSKQSIQSEILSDHFSADAALEPLLLDFLEMNLTNPTCLLPSLNSKMQSAVLKAQLHVKIKFQPTSLKISASILKLCSIKFTMKAGKWGKYQMTGNLLLLFLSANQANLDSRRPLTDP